MQNGTAVAIAAMSVRATNSDPVDMYEVQSPV